MQRLTPLIVGIGLLASSTLLSTRSEAGICGWMRQKSHSFNYARFDAYRKIYNRKLDDGIAPAELAKSTNSRESTLALVEAVGSREYEDLDDMFAFLEEPSDDASIRAQQDAFAQLAEEINLDSSLAFRLKLFPFSLTFGRQISDSQMNRLVNLFYLLKTSYGVRKHPRILARFMQLVRDKTGTILRTRFDRNFDERVGQEFDRTRFHLVLERLNISQAPSLRRWLRNLRDRREGVFKTLLTVAINAPIMYFMWLKTGAAFPVYFPTNLVTERRITAADRRLRGLFSGVSTDNLDAVKPAIRDLYSSPLRRDYVYTWIRRTHRVALASLFVLAIRTNYKRASAAGDALTTTAQDIEEEQRENFVFKKSKENLYESWYKVYLDRLDSPDQIPDQAAHDLAAQLHAQLGEKTVDEVLEDNKDIIPAYAEDFIKTSVKKYYFINFVLNAEELTI